MEKYRKIFFSVKLGLLLWYFTDVMGILSEGFDLHTQIYFGLVFPLIASAFYVWGAVDHQDSRR